MATQTPSDRQELNRDIFKTLIVGEAARGSGGIAHVMMQTPPTIRYLLVHDIVHQELREAVQEVLSEEGDRFMFVVEEDADSKFHLWKVPRRTVAEYNIDELD